MSRFPRRVLGDGFQAPSRGFRAGFRNGATNVCHNFDLPDEWRRSVRVRRRSKDEPWPSNQPHAEGSAPPRRSEREVPALQIVPPGPPEPRFPSHLDFDLGRPDEPLRDRVRRLLSALGEAPALSKLEEAMVTVLLQELERERDRLLPPEDLDPREAQLYERRIAKLNQALDEARESIRRLALLKNVDLGMASMYRDVQGLAESEAHYEMKREMMSHIFRANLELQRTLKQSG